MKICKSCKIAKSLDQFGSEKRTKDGKKARCNECMNLYMREYYAANPQKIKDRALTYHYAHREEANARRRLFRLNNLEKEKAAVRLYALNNRQKINAIAANWKSKNRVKVRQLNQARRNVIKQSDVSTDFIMSLKIQPCVYCGVYKPNQMHIDHVVPIARGGLHEESNLVSACAKCNQSKGSKLVSEWLK